MNWLLKKYRIWVLKRRMRSAYVAYLGLFAQQGAGHKMAQYISPRLRGYAHDFDVAAAECRKLDPNMPGSPDFKLEVQ